MFQWSESDFTEFFGTVASFDEDGHCYTFELHRSDLRLEVALFDLAGAVYVSLFHKDLPAALFTICREECTHAHITSGPDERRYFEAGAPEERVTNMGIPPVLSRGVRVYLEPQFHVELIEPRHDYP